MTARPLIFAALLLFAASCGDDAPRDPPLTRTPLQRACAWLWQQQQHDGSWRSETYGLMRSGQSLTPFVLHALLSVPPDKAPRPDGAVERALAFIRDHTDQQGCLGRADPLVADYPNHATAYAVRCLVAAGNASDRELVRRMCDYLLAQQYNEASGFGPDSPRFGGWGFARVDTPGIMDVAHTRRVLEALRDAEALDAGAAWRARSFLRLIQRDPAESRPQPEVPGEPEGEPSDTFDGSFYFSPVYTGMNKGLFQPARDGRAAWFRGYATATCDGLLALLAAGVPEDDRRVDAARRWLSRHPDLDRPAGIPTDAPTPWDEALHFYHLAVRAEAYSVWADKKLQRRELGRIGELLTGAQHKDGSFTNDKSPLMKENDPILCTALAVIALSRT